MRGAPGGGRAPSQTRAGAGDNKHWRDECYWPRPGSTQDSPPASSSTNPIRSQNLSSDLCDTSGHVARVRCVKSENHIRVLALNNQISMWKQSSVPNSDHNNDTGTNHKNVVANGVHNNDPSEDKCDSIVTTSKLIQPKFKSKLPFSPKSYRKFSNLQ